MTPVRLDAYDDGKPPFKNAPLRMGLREPLETTLISSRGGLDERGGGFPFKIIDIRQDRNVSLSAGLNPRRKLYHASTPGKSQGPRSSSARCMRGLVGVPAVQVGPQRRARSEDRPSVTSNMGQRDEVSVHVGSIPMVRDERKSLRQYLFGLLTRIHRNRLMISNASRSRAFTWKRRVLTTVHVSTAFHLILICGHCNSAELYLSCLTCRNDGFGYVRNVVSAVSSRSRRSRIQRNRDQSRFHHCR